MPLYKRFCSCIYAVILALIASAPIEANERPIEKLPLDELVKRLESADYKTREDVAEALRKLGPKAAKAVPALVPMLGSDNIDTLGKVDKQGNAIEALESIGEHAVPDLLKNLSSDNAKIREGIVRVLGRIRKSAKQTVPELRKRLKDEDSNVQIESAVALLALGQDDKAAIQIVQAAMAEPPVGLLLYQLGQCGPRARALVPALCKVLSSDDRFTREDAIRALEDIGPAAAPALPQLMDALKASDKFERSSAVRALGRIGIADKKMISALIKAAEDEEPNVCSAALYVLKDLQLTSADSAIVLAICKKALKSKDKALRSSVSAAFLLIDWNGKTFDPELLLELCGDSEEWTRCFALIALGNLKDRPKNVLQVAKKATNDNSSLVRTAGFRVLARLAAKDFDPDTLTFLHKAIESGDAQRAERACSEIRAIKPPAKKTIELLVKNLKRDNARCRLSAATSLLELGEHKAEALDVLIECSRLSEKDVRRNSVFALSRYAASEKKAKEALAKLLSDSEYEIRVGAAGKVLNVDNTNDEAKRLLVDALQSRKSRMRSEAMMACNDLPAYSEEIASALNDLIFSQNRYDRDKAERALKHLQKLKK